MAKNKQLDLEKQPLFSIKSDNDQIEMEGINSSYSTGTLITEKYNPLRGINIRVDEQRKFYTDLLTKRINALEKTNIFPKTLILTADWSEDDKPYVNIQKLSSATLARASHPMVVVSGGRALWLKSLFMNMKEKGETSGYNDDNIFTEGVVPWYAPLRSGRHCYIVVHKTEYALYVKSLKDEDKKPFKDVTIVCYEFGKLDPSFRTLVGFGASRYAAVAMAIKLGYEKAWLVDDNVVNINGFPNTLAEMEEKLEPTYYALGFSGATNNVDPNSLYKGSSVLNFNHIPFPSKPPGAGFLQQAVLWNLSALKSESDPTKKLNFSPYFIKSKEDATISDYLQKDDPSTDQPKKQRVAKTYSIIKAMPDNDIKTNKTEAPIETCRKKLEDLVSEKEQAVYVQQNGEPRTEIKKYIFDKFYGESIQPPKNSQDITQILAIEQGLAAAIKLKIDPPLKIFNPYAGFEGDEITLRLAQRQPS